jgi:hypothetical protein
MPADPPVDFQQLAQGATGTTNADYPYAIKATDLMRNFVFATLDIEEGLYDETTGAQGHSQRRLRMSPGTQVNQIAYWDGENYVPMTPPSSKSVLSYDGSSFAWLVAPGSGTHVLGAVGGQIQWIETEECE